jgi:hypothetical protein
MAEKQGVPEISSHKPTHAELRGSYFQEEHPTPRELFNVKHWQKII